MSIHRLKNEIKFCFFDNVIPLFTLWPSIFIVVLSCLIVNAPLAPKLHSNRLNTEASPTLEQHTNLVHFVHLSDIHLSNVIPGIYERFELFLNRSMPVINPSFVIQSGDITHAKESHSFTSKADRQLKHEWRAYQSLLTKYGRYSPDFWLDIKGNHDDMGVLSMNDSSNCYRDFGVAPLRWNRSLIESEDGNHRVYSFTYNTEGGQQYSFVLYDSTELPGLDFPFNVFPSIEMGSIQKSIKRELQNVKDHDIVMMVGHYPIATYWNRKQLFKTWMDSVSDSKVKPSVHLTGHLHLRDMYNRFDNGLIELEVADYKYKSTIRVMAIDNGIFSFFDTTLDELSKKPMVLITNPKDSRYLSQNENWQSMQTSSHIRSLIFSEHAIEKVELYLDGKSVGIMERNLNYTKGVLYQYKWNAEDYNDEQFHKIQVVATDSDNRIGRSTFQFSLSGATKSAHVHLWLNYLQKLNHQKGALMVFLTLFIYGILLLVPKLMYFVLIRDKDRYNGFGQELLEYVLEFNTGSESEYERQYDFNVEIESDFSTKPKMPSLLERTMSFSSVLKFFRMAVWAHTWRFMNIPTISWVVFVLLFVLTLCSPIIIAPLLGGKYWGAYFVWGTWVKGTLLQKRGEALGASILIILFMWLPSIILSAVPSSARAMRVFNQDQSHESRWKRVLSLFLKTFTCLSLSGLLCILSVILSASGAAYFFISVFSVGSYFASPFLAGQFVFCMLSLLLSIILGVSQKRRRNLPKFEEIEI